MTDDLDDFFNEIEEDIVETQKEIAHFAMEKLFEESPHFDPTFSLSKEANASIEFNKKIEELNNKIKEKYKEINILLTSKKITQQEAEKQRRKIGLLFNDNLNHIERQFYENKYGNYKNRSVFSKSQYDANHNILIDDSSILSSGIRPPTYNPKISESFHKIEAQEIDSINEIGHSITITNTVLHAEAVETGFLWKRRDGYFPYIQTEQEIDLLYANKIKKTFSNIETPIDLTFNTEDYEYIGND